MNNDLTKIIEDAKMSVLYDLRLAIEQGRDNYTKEEILKEIDYAAKIYKNLLKGGEI
ncbi:hypothetical protein [Roseburia sp. 1XD42-69]|uniref:hypothetical protein n=1 Tax=Roseburia sp. 1XD42-69 TaxID=2320088 RepID=UPI001314DA8F|nr:hypothetical protein [Roseburia sp. 1XD42-69]